MAKMTMVQALNLALRQEMAKDDRVILRAERAGDGGTRAAWRNLQGLPAYAAGEEVDLEALRSRHPELVDRDKVYFVGQERFEEGDQARPLFTWESASEPLKRTPLYETHAAATKKNNIVPFAGYEMPVFYSSIAAEHAAVRTACGLFDVSHMGEVRVRGPKAEDALMWLLSNAIRRIEPGHAQYNAMCNAEGGVVDDVTLYRFSNNRFMFCVNAANIDKDFAWMQQVLADASMPDVTLVNRSEEFAQIALQGPAAEKILGLTLDQMKGRTSIDPRWKALTEDGSPLPGEKHPAMVALRTGKPVFGFVMGVSNVRFDQTRWILVNATPEFLPESEKPHQVFTTFEDITDRVNALKRGSTD